MSSKTIWIAAIRKARGTEPVMPTTPMAVKILPQTFQRSALKVSVLLAISMITLMPISSGKTRMAKGQDQAIAAMVVQPPSMIGRSMPRRSSIASPTGCTRPDM